MLQVIDDFLVSAATQQELLCSRKMVGERQPNSVIRDPLLRVLVFCGTLLSNCRNKQLFLSTEVLIHVIIEIIITLTRSIPISGHSQIDDFYGRRYFYSGSKSFILLLYTVNIPCLWTCSHWGCATECNLLLSDIRSPLILF